MYTYWVDPGRLRRTLAMCYEWSLRVVRVGMHGSRLVTGQNRVRQGRTLLGAEWQCRSRPAWLSPVRCCRSGPRIDAARFKSFPRAVVAWGTEQPGPPDSLFFPIKKIT